MMRSVVAITIVLCCAGCGGAGESGSAVDGGRSTAPPYEGPLNAKAAVAALECDGETPFFRSTGSYDDGLATVQPSAVEAFDNYVDASGIGYSVPVAGYRVEREEASGALISYDVRDRSKVAVVVAPGIRDWNDQVGWGVVAWAQCDPAEFPAEVTDDLNIGVWEDASGRRIPTTRVRSFQGAEHCSWTDITFLLIGPDERRADWYVRDASGEFPDYLRGDFDPDATLPTGATFTGWSRGGRRLWLSPDKQAAYLVDINDPRVIERWPAAKEPILCA
jgi:hypothetical protein